MQTLILKSENEKALAAINALAKVLKIESNFDEEDDENFSLTKGVKMQKGKGKFNVQKLAGSLTDMNVGNASTLRSKAWTR